MVAVGAAAVAILAVPGLGRLVAMAGARAPDPRILTAAALGAALLIVWRADGVLHGSALAAVATVGLTAGWVDAHRRRLPDALVLPAYPLVGALVITAADPDAMIRATVCAVAGAGLYAIGWAFGQLGFGDVKLAGLLGLVLGWTGWQAALVALVAAALIGGAQAIAVLALRRSDMPYGPAMLLGAASAVAITPWLGT